MQLAEESVKYKLKEEGNRYSHDKLIKNILQDTKEVAELINQYVEPREEVKQTELVKYTNSYITKKYKAKEADLVYKLKNQDIFFLVELQCTIDENMSYRMLNYCLDIMREWGKNKKIGRNTFYPMIVPIVIYTGNEKWKIPKKIKEKQVDGYTYERYRIDIEYNFIDVNRISKQMLLEKNTMFSYAMFLEKAKNHEELIYNLNIILNSATSKKNLQELYNIIYYLLDDVLDKKTQIKLLEKIDRRVGEKEMSTLVQRLKADLQYQKEQAKKEEKKEIAKKLLDKKANEELILEVTGIKKQELKEIKKEMALAS